MRVRFPHGVLKNNRAEVQMAARRFWEQEGLGSTPRRATYTVVEGWLPIPG